MADKLENTLNSGTPAQVRALDSAGNSIKCDLNTLANAMPVATAYAKGVMSSSNAIALANMYVSFGVAGGQPTSWRRIAVIEQKIYIPCWVRLSYGPWNSSSRSNVDVVITYGTDTDVAISGTANNQLGYVINDNDKTMSIYFKCTAVMSVVGQVLGTHKSIQDYTEEEPTGIVYIP